MTKTAVVTGASSGLGAIFAEQLAQRGFSLVLAGRDRARLEAVKQRVGPGTEVELVAGDLGADAGLDDLIARLGGRAIDVLVNNAGFGTYGPFAEIDADRERELVAVNVDALGSDVSHTAIYRHLAEPGPVVAAGLRGLDRGRAVVVPGWRYRMMATGGRLAPGWLSALMSGRMLRPAAAPANAA